MRQARGSGGSEAAVPTPHAASHRLPPLSQNLQMPRPAGAARLTLRLLMVLLFAAGISAQEGAAPSPDGERASERRAGRLPRGSRQCVCKRIASHPPNCLPSSPRACRGGRQGCEGGDRQLAGVCRGQGAAGLGRQSAAVPVGRRHLQRRRPSADPVSRLEAQCCMPAWMARLWWRRSDGIPRLCEAKTSQENTARVAH